MGETDFADGEIHLDKEGRKTKRREGAGVGRDREREREMATARGRVALLNAGRSWFRGRVKHARNFLAL